MLISAAAGSAASRPITGARSERWAVAFVGVLVTGAALLAVLAPVNRLAMARPIGLRVGAAGGLIAPLAFFMGMPFPLGILALSRKPEGAVAWAWSVNGLFTTVGAVLSALLSLWLGFRATLIVALIAYAAAAALFARLRRSNAANDAVRSCEPPFEVRLLKRSG
jgi:hypothetical protein